MKLKKLVREMSFYPTCFDDPKDKDVKLADKVKVNFKSYPSGLQVAKYETIHRKGSEYHVKYDYVSMILNHVESIENLFIGDDKITTAIELGDYEDSRLYNLLVDIRVKLLDDSEVITEKEK